MKKLLLLLFLVIGLSFVVQAVPAPDRDVGCVTYVMPSQQINNVSVVAAVPTVQTLYLDTGQQYYGDMQPYTKEKNQCLLSVVPPYKGPMSIVQVNESQYYIGANFT